MAKLSGSMCLAMAAFMLASVHVVVGQDAPAPTAQQQSEDPIAQARAAWAQISANMAQLNDLSQSMNDLSQIMNSPLNEMAQNFVSQLSQNADSLASAAPPKPLVRKRRAAGYMGQQQPMQQQQAMQTMQQQPLVPANNGLDPQQQQQLQQQSNRLQTLMQSIQYNVTPEQMQQIVVTLIMIMVTLFTGTAAVGPSVAIMQSILKQVLPVMVNALMQMTGSYTTPAAISAAPAVAPTPTGW